MNFYKAIVSYDGSTFSGWQYQAENSNTVQEYLINALKKLCKVDELKLFGASRTDKGVHASYQVIRLEISKELREELLIKGFNQEFGHKVKLMFLEEVSQDFNPQQGIIYKEYHYSFSEKELPAHLSHFIHTVGNKLNMEEIQKALNLLQGRHDFKKFCVQGSREGETIRDISLCSIQESILFGEKIYTIKIRSSGFFKYMVRMLVGSLIDIGLGNISMQDLSQQLKGQEVFKPPRAPAKGLNLFFIKFK